MKCEWTLATAWEKSKKAGMTITMGLSDGTLSSQGLKDAFLITYSHLFHPRSPSASESPTVYFWYTRVISTYSLLFSVVLPTVWNQKKPLCMSWIIYNFIWVSRTKYEGEYRECFLLSWRASLCSCHAGGIEVHRRIQSYQCPLPTLWETGPHNWISKRELENLKLKGLQKMRTCDRPTRAFPRLSLTNLDGDSSKETLDSLEPPREESFFFHSRFHSRLRGRRT